MAADSQKPELHSLEILKKHSQESLSSNYIVQLFDSFTHKGPNGVHQCHVLELLGPTLSYVLDDYLDAEDHVLAEEPILRKSTQLLKAVKFLHSAGICHGGKSFFVSFTKNSLMIGRPEVLTAF